MRHIPIVFHSTVISKNALLHNLYKFPRLQDLVPLTRRHRRFQWARDLRRRSTAARPLRLCVQIPPEAWMFVVCCQVQVSDTDWSLVQRSSTDCGASLCVIKKPRKWGS